MFNLEKSHWLEPSLLSFLASFVISTPAGAGGEIHGCPQRHTPGFLAPPFLAERGMTVNENSQGPQNNPARPLFADSANQGILFSGFVP
jgi:hypothetical protein